MPVICFPLFVQSIFEASQIIVDIEKRNDIVTCCIKCNSLLTLGACLWGLQFGACTLNLKDMVCKSNFLQFGRSSSSICRLQLLILYCNKAVEDGAKEWIVGSPLWVSLRTVDCGLWCLSDKFCIMAHWVLNVQNCSSVLGILMVSYCQDIGRLAKETQRLIMIQNCCFVKVKIWPEGRINQERSNPVRVKWS